MVRIPALVVFSLLSLSISLSLWAHPVIYKEGIIYQGMFTPAMNEIRVGYSASAKHAFIAGANYFAKRGNYQDYTMGVNYLFKRWFLKESQGNIYGGIHYGRYANDFRNGNVGKVFLMGDWESRKHYVTAKVRGNYYDSSDPMQNEGDYTLRYGFAPFVGGMKVLQPWLILQTSYYRSNSRSAVITPILRMFYRNVLWEMGYSTRGQSFLTLMVHY